MKQIAGIPHQSVSLMNPKQRRFFQLYLGSNADFLGNATRCYKAVYGMMDDRSAQTCGSRLVRKFQDFISEAERIQVEQLQLDAGRVLRDSERILRRAMGDDPIVTAKVSTDPDTGEERIESQERHDYDPATATKALQLIGNHKDIQAFSVTVEHNHTHRLEQRLAARSKVIEAKATSIPGDGGGEALPAPGDAVPVEKEGP